MTRAEVTRPSGREVVFSRIIAAPVELVFEAWTEVRHLHEWFGPSGFSCTTTEFAFRPGGVWQLIMHGPDGTDYPTRIVFQSIEPNARIVYANNWDLPGAPLDFIVVVTFAREGEGTRIDLHITFADDEAMQTAIERYGVLPGGVQTFERLANHLER